MTFRQQLKKWRGGRSRLATAELLGVPYSTYRSWENGHRTPGRQRGELFRVMIFEKMMLNPEKKTPEVRQVPMP